MKRILLIIALCFTAFILESCLYQWFGAWGKPELLVLVFVFFNLYLGVRFGLVAALVCGLLKDVSAVVPFGTYIFVFILSAYATSLAREVIYQPGSRFSRAMVAFVGVVVCFIGQVIVRSMFQEIRFNELFVFLLIPQLVTTMVVSNFVFLLLRNISVFFQLKS